MAVARPKRSASIADLNAYVNSIVPKSGRTNGRQDYGQRALAVHRRFRAGAF